MTRNPWILAVCVLAAVPAACVVTLDNGGPGGYGAAGAGNGSGSGSGGGSAQGGDQCNPVTNAGCASDGSACDLDPSSGSFKCFPPPNTVDVCGACDDATIFCGSDLTCVFPSNAVAGACFRYCCTDADCGAGATCDVSFGTTVLQPSNPSDAVGLCVTTTVTDDPACGPPATSPSGGACVGGYSSSPDGGTMGDGGTTTGDGGTTTGDGGTTTGDGGGSPDDGGFGDAGHGGRHDGGA